MIFEALYKSAIMNELILVDGGYCRFHLRLDGQLTILEIIVLPCCHGEGIAQRILKELKTKGAKTIFAKCPAELPANGWYSKMGFECESTETTKSGREINHWRLQC